MWVVVVPNNIRSKETSELGDAVNVSLNFANTHEKEYVRCYSDVRILLKDMTAEDAVALQLTTHHKVIEAPDVWVEIMTNSFTYPRSTHYER